MPPDTPMFPPPLRQPSVQSSSAEAGHGADWRLSLRQTYRPAADRRPVWLRRLIAWL